MIYKCRLKFKSQLLLPKFLTSNKLFILLSLHFLICKIELIVILPSQNYYEKLYSVTNASLQRSSKVLQRLVGALRQTNLPSRLPFINIVLPEWRGYMENRECFQSCFKMDILKNAYSRKLKTLSFIASVCLFRFGLHMFILDDFYSLFCSLLDVLELELSPSSRFSRSRNQNQYSSHTPAREEW